MIKRIFSTVISFALILSMFLMIAGCETNPAVTEYTITAENGTVSGAKNSNGKFDKGTTVTLTAKQPEEGYKFVRWTINGNEISTEPSFSFKAARNVHYVAVFELIDFPGKLFYITVEGGKIIGTMESGALIPGEAAELGTYEKFEVIVLKADTISGKMFVHWLSDGVIVSEESEYEVAVLGDVTYTAVFVDITNIHPSERIPDFTSARFYDDFSYQGTLDSNKWDYDEGGGGFGNDEIQYYTRNNIRVEDGKAIMTLKKQDMGTRNYTSGKFWSRNKFSSTYGKIEARIRLFNNIVNGGYTSGQTQGLWPAFWMMPASNTYGGWPYSGEIDIMEVRGRFPGQMNSTIHRRPTASGGDTWVSMATSRYRASGLSFSTGDYANDFLYSNVSSGSTCADWHIYTVEWDYNGDRIEFRYYVDDILYNVITQSMWNAFNSSGQSLAKPKPFDHNFYVIFNLALGGNFDGRRVPSGTGNSIPANAPLFAEGAPPIEYEIDWVYWGDIVEREPIDANKVSRPVGAKYPS